MREKIPTLDREALKGLLEAFQELGARPRGSIPMAELIRIPASLAGGVALTVDFALSRELGREFIVVQVPSPAGRLSGPSLDPRLAVLTARELEIAALVASGLTNKEIARKLSLTLATIKSHLHHILSKSGLPNRAAVAVAMVSQADPPTNASAIEPSALKAEARLKRDQRTQ
jgi:DNA-binding CsgD family transcriptional regulator